MFVCRTRSTPSGRRKKGETFSHATEPLIALMNSTSEIRMMIVRNAQVQALCLTDELGLHDGLKKAQSLLSRPKPGLKPRSKVLNRLDFTKLRMSNGEVGHASHENCTLLRTKCTPSELQKCHKAGQSNSGTLKPSHKCTKAG